VHLLMKNAAATWFHRGKDARRRGQERAILDGRMSLESRRNFLAGWDDQHRRESQPTAAQVAESHRVAAKLRDFAHTLKGPGE